MFELIESKRKREKLVDDLWKKFWELENQLDDDEYERIMMSNDYHNIKDVIEYELNNEIEFNGSIEIHLGILPERLEKAIQELKEYLENR